MNPIDTENAARTVDTYMPEDGKYALSYPELCSEFLSALARAIKNTALYTLSHPLVIESLRKNLSLLDMIFASDGKMAFTLSFLNESWMFNDTAVPAVTAESQNLNAFFRTHGILGLEFMNGVQLYELGALCEFLGAAGKNQPEGYMRDFLAKKGVTNIRPETVHYVKDRGNAPQAGYGTAAGAAPGTVAGAGLGHAVRPETVKAAQYAPPYRSAVPKAAPAAAVPGARPSRASGWPATVPESVPSSVGGSNKTAPGKLPVEPAGQATPQRDSALSKMNFGDILTRLVESAVNDPRERVRVYEDALKLIRENMDAQVARTTKALVEEKERVLNTRTRTEKVLARVADGKVIVDKEGKVLMMNPAAEEISGKKFRDIAGKHISEHLKPGEHFLTLSEDMDLSGGKSLSGEVSSSGDERVGNTMRRSMALLQDDEGRVVGAYATLPDITKFKEAQRMQEEFLSRVTHDLQSPLSSISSALEMLTDTAAAKLDGDENKFLAISVRNSQRLTQMIRGILDFSKLQSGKMPVHLEPVSVAAMLAEAGEALLPWCRTKGLTLTVRPPEPDVIVMADQPRIVQVLTNLISNAIKSTPKGGTIIVAASRVIDGGRNAVIGVRDTGRGISKEDLNKLFKKFVQIEDAHGLREGVGLGLAIVNEFVALHGGRIWADSELGKGATFYFTLPLAERS